MNRPSTVTTGKLSANPTRAKRIEDKRLMHKGNSVGGDFQVDINPNI
jgi:hypothetical protein